MNLALKNVIFVTALLILLGFGCLSSEPKQAVHSVQLSEYTVGIGVDVLAADTFVKHPVQQVTSNTLYGKVE